MSSSTSRQLSRGYKYDPAIRTYQYAITCACNRVVRKIFAINKPETERRDSSSEFSPLSFQTMCIRTCTADGVELEDNSLAKVVENPAVIGLDSSVEIQNSVEVVTRQDSMNSVEEIKKISVDEVIEKPESIMQCPFAAQRKVFKGKDKFIKKYEEIMKQNQNNSEDTAEDNSTHSNDFLGKTVGSFKNLTDIISYYCNINHDSPIYK